MSTDTTSPEALRTAMVEQVRTRGYARWAEVERVLRDTPRHEFVPDVDLTTAYNPWQAVVTHRDADGCPRSSASAPVVVAMMLDQLQVRPGDRVLEIGAGTGYNACLLAQLTGRADLVTTVDIDPDVTARAKRALDTAGYGDVHVIIGNGAFGHPDHAPYDRIIATVSPWDIPAAWWEQLAPGGRLVVPLRWRGQTRSVAFAYTDGRLVSDSVELCGFVYLVGVDEGECSGALTEDGAVELGWDADQAVDLDALRGVLDQPRTTVWPGVTIPENQPYGGIWLRLTATDRRVCRIESRSDVPPEACAPARCWAPALVDGGSLAYLTSRRHENGDVVRWELGAIGHGPAAAELTERLCEEIRTWAAAPEEWQPTVIAYPAGTPDAELPCDGAVIDKTHCRMVLVG